MPAAGPAAAPGRGRDQLPALIQEVGEILAQGEESGTPSRHTELRSQLRAVLIRLVDLSTAAFRRGAPPPSASTHRELAAVLQLLTLTMDKVPHYLSGDGNALALDILRRLIILLPAPLAAKASTELPSSVARIVLRVAETDADQLAALCASFCDLFQDAYTAAIALSLDPSNAAVIKFRPVLPSGADSRPGLPPEVELDLDSPSACDRVLQVTLKVLTEALASRAAVSAALVPGDVLAAAACLLSCSSLALQAAAMQFLAAVLRAQSAPHPALRRLPDRLRTAVAAAPAALATAEDASGSRSAQKEWFYRLVALLNVLADVPAAFLLAGASKQGVAQLAASATATAAAAGNDAACARLCDLVADLVGRDPALLEAGAPVLRLLGRCRPDSRAALLGATGVYLAGFDSQQMQHALRVAMDAAAAGSNDAGGPPPAKRPRSAHASNPGTEDMEAEDEVDDIRPGLMAVVSALLAAVKDLKARIADVALSPDVSLAADALADLLPVLAPVNSSWAADVAVKTVKLWHGWGPLQLGGRVAADHAPSGLRLLAAGMEVALASGDSETRKTTAAAFQGLGTALVSCVRAEGAAAPPALAVALLGASLGLSDLSTAAGSAFVECFEAARGKTEGTQATRAALLPAAAALASTPPPPAPAGRGKAKAAPPPPSNPFKGTLLRMAAVQDPEITTALVSGLRGVIAADGDPSAMVLNAIHASQTGIFLHVSSNSSGSRAVQGSGDAGASSDTHARTLPPAVCDWARPALVALCASVMAGVIDAAGAGPDLVEAVASFLSTAPPAEAEASPALAKWLLAAAGSSDPATRAAVLRHAALLAVPQVVLAAAEESGGAGGAAAAHPGRDRRSLALKHEQHIILALKGHVQGAAATDVSREADLLQLIARVGCAARSPQTRWLTLAILMLSLETRDVEVGATAAECLRGVAAARGCGVRELFLGTPRLVEHVGRQLPSKPDLLHELADLVGMSPRALALAVLPKALPQLAARRDRDAIDKLADQAGMSAKRLMLEHGHHALAASLTGGAGPPMDDLIALTEEITGQDFIVIASAILPRTVIEMVAQTGFAPEWGTATGAAGGVGGGSGLPEDVVAHTSKMLALLASTTAGGAGAEAVEPSRSTTAEFLAEGDHVTRMLKEFGDELERRLAAGVHSNSSAAAADVGVTLGVLRRILVLIHLTGTFVGRFLPQFMVLLGAAVRPGNPREVKLQGLVGWRLLVKALAAEAPVQLGGIVNQIVVTLLEGLQEGGPVGAAAARVVEDVIAACRRHFPEKVRTLPPLPQRMVELRHVNTLMAEARGSLSVQQQVELLLEGLGAEALSVRSTALQELRAVLSGRRDIVATLRDDHALHMRLLGALLKAAEPGASSPAAAAAQQACAECLGMLGAVDPSRVKLDPPPPVKRCESAAQLALEVMTHHLVRLLKTAPSLMCLDATTLAIQEVLRCQADSAELRIKAGAAAAAQPPKKRTPGRARRGEPPPPPDANALFIALPEEVQAIVRPYLDSKFSFRASGKKAGGVLFHPGLSFRRWFTLWLTQLIDDRVTGEFKPLLEAVKPVLRHDIPTAMFVAPYVIRGAVAGGTAAAAGVAAEMLAVLAAQDGSRDGVLCAQAVFTLLDVLQRWYEEIKAAATGTYSSVATDSGAGGDSGGAATAAAMTALNGTEWAAVRELLRAIPKATVAQAAAAAGAHARAVHHFEAHLRAVHNGALNPSSFKPPPAIADADVTFLLEVYSRLEEPDGLDGLVKLRAGGPAPEDQRLAAEKAGSWSEALALYERELGRCAAPEAAAAAAESGDGGEAARRWGATQRGYLNCLLQMGHWQGLLAQVEGTAALLAGTPAAEEEAPRLAAMGAAAAWRLGRWAPLDRYLESAQAGFGAMNAEERWESRVARLLRETAAAAAAGASAGAAVRALAPQLEAARAEVMGPFSAAAMESYSRAYSHLVKLHMLQEVADAVAMLGKHAPKERRRALRWDERLELTQASLTTQAPILALRRQLASISGAPAEAAHCLLTYARACRATGHLDAAVPAVLEAATAGAPGAHLERVELLYARGEQTRALSELHALADALAAANATGAAGEDLAGMSNDAERTAYRARVALRLAEYTAATGQGTRDEVVGWFQRALQERDGWETGLFRYAVYLDELMQDARARQEAGAAAGGGGSSRDRLGGRSRIKLGEDKPHLSLLPEVLANYGRAVQAGSRHIYRALPRLLTLFFDFGATAAATPDASLVRATADQIWPLMKGLGKQIHSHAWLIALPQLTSRICHRHDQVASITRTIVTATLSAYPLQAMWALMAVTSSDRSNRRNTGVNIINSARRQARTEPTRVAFVEFQNFMTNMRGMCLNTVPPAKRTVSMSKDLNLKPLFRMAPTPYLMPTMAQLTPALPPADAAAATGWTPFSDEVTIAGFKDEVEVMNSLQKPRKVVFIGSDGREYPFLAKPKDDLRKDCRMMEAAGVVNKTFQEEATARRRNLYLRRFAVVPVNDESGLIEWVEHTRPLRSCINDMAESPQAVRNMHSVVKSKYDRAAKGGAPALVAWLVEMAAAYPPALHRWFLARWAEPAAWLAARLNFTRTYAAWTMVGHVAGLGDRHGENVLLDCSSGDAIQIDFGCLFDKGLTLTMPEMVPFRLTQNVVDGFGVTGVEGVYRRSAEATLGVLRKHRDTILSVMDTFVHDPLVEWARSEKNLRSGPAGGEGEGENPQAKDAMATIEGRLKGTLLGVSSRPCMPLSVEGHVAALVAEATSRDNLSRMYIWWAPWQ